MGDRVRAISRILGGERSRSDAVRFVGSAFRAGLNRFGDARRVGERCIGGETRRALMLILNLYLVFSYCA